MREPDAPSAIAPAVDAAGDWSADFGAFLVDRQLLSIAGLERARRVHGETGDPIESILARLGLVSETDLSAMLAQYLDLPLAGPADYPDTPVLEDQIKREFLRSSRVVPLADRADAIAVAMADPRDEFAARSLEMWLGKPVRRYVGRPADIEAAFARLYPERSGGRLPAVVAGKDADTSEDVERLRDLASEAPVIRLVNSMVERAVAARASDIHVESLEGQLRVRYRIDGVLREQEPPPSQLRAAVISRIKIVAKLNIAESRLPQDGRTNIVIRGREIELRVSTVPFMHGESVAMRILDRSQVALDFPSLGFDQDSLDAYLAMLDRPYGIVLVTGPTGSGKTTTLYTSLVRMNTGERKILTVEDPIEYQLAGINQLQVKPAIGLTFAHALRSFLRQDPDVIMVGEIRDLETARIAVQAGLTGHKVLSTLHTNDAAGAVTRLLEMGVDDYLVASTLNGILAQRLVRRLCPECREPYAPSQEISDRLRLYDLAPGTPLLYHPVGCRHCGGTGYHGRISLAEVLVMTDETRRAVLRDKEASAITSAAIENGMRTLYQDGILKALAGITSVDEVMRATNLD